MLEMYIQGVSTRKVKTITEELCGHEFSSATISRIVQKLDEELERFAKRKLEEPYPYLILDARYKKVPEDGAERAKKQSAGSRFAACPPKAASERKRHEENSQHVSRE